MTAESAWETLSSYFDTSQRESMSAAVADNVLVAWPAVIETIQQFSLCKKECLNIVDYGCGGGGFALELASRGHDVVGIDNAGAMIDVAQRQHGSHVRFIEGDAQLLGTLGPLDVVTSIMVVQFIEGLEGLFADFARALKADGLLVIVVFTPEYVTEQLQRTDPTGFRDFDSTTHPKKGLIEFENGAAIPTYIRTVEEYDAVTKAHGFSQYVNKTVPFTDEYLQRYPSEASEHAEYLLLAYRKTS